MALFGPLRPIHPLGRGVAIEFQDPSTWREKALAEASSPEATLNALLALTHVSAKTRHTASMTRRPPTRPSVTRSWRTSTGSPGTRSTVTTQLDLLRVYEVVLNRFGRPDESTVKRLIGRFGPYYPSRVRELNAELCQLLIYLRGAGRRRQDGRASRASAHAGRTDPLRPGPAHAQGRAGRPRFGRRISPGSRSRASSRAAIAFVVSWRTSSAMRSPT